jgi:hypothetical protein
MKAQTTLRVPFREDCAVARVGRSESISISSFQFRSTQSLISGFEAAATVYSLDCSTVVLSAFSPSFTSRRSSPSGLAHTT